MRFEFLEVVIRVAIAKFVKPKVEIGSKGGSKPHMPTCNVLNLVSLPLSPPVVS